LCGGTIELDAKKYTLARKIYLSLHPDKRRPSVEGEREVVLFYGCVTIDPSAGRDLDRPYSAQFYLDSDFNLGPLAFFSFDETINAIDFYSKMRPLYRRVMSIFSNNEVVFPLQDGGDEHSKKRRWNCDVGPDLGHGPHLRPNVKQTK
jgi:hypothetical protein